MIFLYSPFAGEEKIRFQKGDENFLYLSKVKRYAVGEKIEMSNVEDNTIYSYIFLEITKKEILLEKISAEKSEEHDEKKTGLHLYWGVCDPKTIYKTLPFLNELGVSDLTFVECERTQRNFSKQLQKNLLPHEKIQKILEQSCQQCGRNSRMRIGYDALKNILESLEGKDEYFMICDFPSEKNFSDVVFSLPEDKEIRVLVGPEGGFSPAEKKIFQEKFPEKVVQFSGNTVMRSETAIVSVAGKFLL